MQNMHSRIYEQAIKHCIGLNGTIQSRRGNETYNFWHAAEMIRDRDVDSKSTSRRQDRDVQRFVRDETETNP